MAETLLIHCPDIASQEVSWQVQGGLQTLSGSGDLDEASLLAKGRRTLVLIPASEVTITKVALPTKNRQRLVQAIPYALETELTQDVEQIHFAVGETAADNTTPVIIISRSRLEEWLSHLESVAIEPLGIYVDLLSLPLKDGHWSLYADRDSLLARTSEFEGFSADLNSGESLIRMALGQYETPPQSADLYQLADALPFSLGESTNLQTQAVTIENHTGLIELLAGDFKEKQQINLLQGDYQRVDKLTLHWKRWLPAAVLAGAAIALSLIVNISDYFVYQRQNAELDSQIQQVFKQAFPNVKRIVDPKVQMEQQLKAMRGGQRGGTAQFASLFIPAASVIKSSPNTRLESVSFRDGQLDLQLTIKELQALENLKKTIEERALNVEIRTANASGNQVTSHLRITGGGR